MKILFGLLVWSAVACQAADWRLQDIHPKVFQMVDCWISDTSAPVLTEINLDAVRANRNQFDYKAVGTEGEWITYREGAEMLRFKPVISSKGEYTIVYQQNGGGSLTTQRTIRFAIARRKLEVDGRGIEATVLRVLSMDSKNES